jgi:hypothetical protein
LQFEKAIIHLPLYIMEYNKQNDVAIKCLVHIKEDQGSVSGGGSGIL